MERNNRIPVYLSNDEKQRYTAMADHDGRSLTAEIRHLLECAYLLHQHVSRYQSVEQVMELLQDPTNESLTETKNANDQIDKTAASQSKPSPNPDSQQLVSVDLVFENVESYNVSAQFINNLHLTNVTPIYDYTANGGEAAIDGDVNYYAADARINLDAASVDALLADQYEELKDESLTLLQRILRYQDLVALDLHYADGSHRYVNVFWGSFGDSLNTAMVCSTGFHHDLEIDIQQANDFDPYANVKNEADAQEIDEQRQMKMRKLYHQLLNKDQKD